MDFEKGKVGKLINSIYLKNSKVGEKKEIKTTIVNLTESKKVAL